MLSWANPGSLSDWTSFERHYVDALKFGQKRNCSDLQLAMVPSHSLRLVFSPAQASCGWKENLSQTDEALA